MVAVKIKQALFARRNASSSRPLKNILGYFLSFKGNNKQRRYPGASMESAENIVSFLTCPLSAGCHSPSYNWLAVDSRLLFDAVFSKVTLSPRTCVSVSSRYYPKQVKNSASLGPPA